MVFKINSKQLLSALNICGKAMNQKVLNPILENYLFDISEKELKISGSNQEVYICKSLPIEAGGNIKIAIPTKLAEQINSLPDQPLEFNIDRLTLEIVIKSATGTYKLSGEDGEMFPPIKNDGKNKLKLSGLQNAFYKTAFCIGVGTNTPFDGLNMSIKKDGVTFTAFANSTLSTQTVPSTSKVEADIILPKRFVDIVHEFDSADIVFSDTSIDFIIDETLFIRSVLMDMKFPDFKANVQLDHDKVLTVDATTFNNAAKITKVMANSFSNLVGLFLSEKSCSIKAQDKNMNRESLEKFDADYKGEDFIIGVNGTFLISALSKLKGELFVFLSDRKKPMIIRETNDNSTYNNLIIVMPIDIDF